MLFAMTIAAEHMSHDNGFVYCTFLCRGDGLENSGLPGDDRDRAVAEDVKHFQSRRETRRLLSVLGERCLDE
jgi:hypothetical protein